MGDRSNICLHYADTESVIWLYGHWTGTSMARVLWQALSRRQRWDDSAYLARIIANELFAPALGYETGFGLSPFICDNERPVLHVYLGERTVKVDADDARAFTFDEFCALDRPESVMGPL